MAAKLSSLPCSEAFSPCSYFILVCGGARFTCAFLNLAVYFQFRTFALLLKGARSGAKQVPNNLYVGFLGLFLSFGGSKTSPAKLPNPYFHSFRAENTMTATDVTGLDAIFSTGFFATFSRFWGARLTKLHINTGEKAKIQWRASSGDGRPEIADFCPLSWSNLS